MTAQTRDFQIPFDRELTAPVVSDLVSDPFETGFPMILSSSWDNTMFPANVGVGPGDGLTAAVRRSRLQSALNRAAALGKEFKFPGIKGYEYEIDNNLTLAGLSGLVIHQDGDMFNSSVNTAQGGQNQTIYKLGNYHGTNLNLLGSQTPSSSTGLTFWTCGSPTFGTDTVILDSGANRTGGLAALAVGMVVVFRSAAFYLSSAVQLPDYVLVATILAVDSGTGAITIDQAFDESVTDCYIANSSSSLALDLQGAPVFIANGNKVIGPGRWRSLGSPTQRTATNKVLGHLGEWVGETGFYGNMFAFSHFSTETMTVTEKLCDIACSSHFSTFRSGHTTFQGPGDTVSMMLMSENTRECKVSGHTLLAGEFTANVIAALLSSRKVGIDIDHVIAPTLINAPVSMQSNAFSGSGQTQPRSHDQSVRFGVFKGGTGLGSFVDMGNPGGQLVRPKVRGTFLGTPTSRAATIAGTEPDITDCYFESGAALVSSTTQAKLANTYFAGGITYSATTAIQNRISGLDSVSWRAFRALAADTTPNTTITSTTVGNDIVAPFVVPAATFANLDRISFLITGRATGTNDTKTIQITDNTGALVTLILAAAFVGSFNIAGSVNISTNAIYVTSFSGAGTPVTGGVFTAAGTLAPRRTGLDLAANGRTFTYEAWVTNASDSIIIDAYRFTPQRYGHVAAGV